MEPERRWNNGYGYKRRPYFMNAIRKYGWDSFKHEMLFVGLSKEEAERKETSLLSLEVNASVARGIISNT